MTGKVVRMRPRPASARTGSLVAIDFEDQLSEIFPFGAVAIALLS
jgi:hypothetical protein